MSVPADAPVTTVPAIVAAALLSVQVLVVPLLPDAVNVIDEATQPVSGPVTVPATGKGFTVTDIVATSVPQLFVTE